MTEPRLATHILVASLIRRSYAAGDTATVIAKGDETAGGLIIIGRIKGAKPALYERMPTLSGQSDWTLISAQAIDNEQEISEYLARRRATDRDLWVLELDVAFQERLTGLLNP
jgi:hypothetical protein